MIKAKFKKIKTPRVPKSKSHKMMAIKSCRLFLLNKRLETNRLKLRHEVNDNIIVKVQNYFMKQQATDVSEFRTFASFSPIPS